MHSVQRIQGMVRASGGCRENGGRCGCRASRRFKGNQRLQADGWKVWMCSIQRIQGMVGQLEVGGRRVGGLNVQHLED